MVGASYDQSFCDDDDGDGGDYDDYWVRRCDRLHSTGRHDAYAMRGGGGGECEKIKKITTKDKQHLLQKNTNLMFNTEEFARRKLQDKFWSKLQVTRVLFDTIYTYS